MRCPYCHHNDSKVIDSRELQAGESIRRRRECFTCTQRFTTYERVEPITVLVIKRDGVREEFDRQKLAKGIRIACTKRPISADQLDSIVSHVEADIFRRGESEIASQEIGELVISHLRDIDPVAYIRFASVYLHFNDLTDMRNEMDRIQKARPDPEQPPPG